MYNNVFYIVVNYIYDLYLDQHGSCCGFMFSFFFLVQEWQNTSSFLCPLWEVLKSTNITAEWLDMSSCFHQSIIWWYCYVHSVLMCLGLYSNTARKMTWVFVMLFAVPTGQRHSKHSDIKKYKTSFICCSGRRIFFSRILSQ